VAVERIADGEIAVDVRRASGDKCPRCWRVVTDAIPDGDLAGLCERCADVVGGPVASRP
jgi:isoleucyl-tRNA synthetase